MAKFPRKPPMFRIRYTGPRSEDPLGTPSTTEGNGRPEPPGPRTMRIRVHDAVTEASRGKVWWYRVPLLIPIAWIFSRHLADSEYGSIFAGLNLAIHEVVG